MPTRNNTKVSLRGVRHDSWRTTKQSLTGLLRSLRSLAMTGNIIYYLFFFAAVALLYGRTVFFDLTFLDDNIWVEEYHFYLSQAAQWWSFFIKPDFVTEFYYRPLLNLSFYFDAHLSGLSPLGFHLTNLILHWVSVCLVFAILTEWGFHRRWSVLGSLVLLVHPALVQAVVWIPGRTDALSAVFCFAAFFSFLKFHRTDHWKYLAGYYFFLICALLTKETAVVLPLMVFTWDWMNAKSKRDVIKRTAVAGVIVGLWVFIRWLILKDSTPVPMETAVSTFVKNLPALWIYLGKAFLPVNLSVFPILKDSRLIFGFMSFIVLLGWFIEVRQKITPKVFWALAWFILFLLPSLVLSDIEYEYRLYVPLLGMLIMGLELLPAKETMSKVSLAVGLVVIGLGTWATWTYAENFRDQWSFWPRAVQDAPHSPLAQRNLAAMYQLKGDNETAEAHYLRALEINPEEKMAHNNLGLIYQNRGDLAKAQAYYLKEIQLYPSYGLPYYNLALIQLRENNLSAGEILLKKAIQLNPLFVDAYHHLISIHLYTGQTDLVREEARRLKSLGGEIPPLILDQARRLNVNLLD